MQKSTIITKLRESNLAEIARDTGVSATTLRRLRDNTGVITKSTLFVLSAYFGESE